MLFVRVPGAKTQKIRLHFELDPDDQAAEVRRLLALGASTSTSASATSAG